MLFCSRYLKSLVFKEKNVVQKKTTKIRPSNARTLLYSVWYCPNDQYLEIQTRSDIFPKIDWIFSKKQREKQLKLADPHHLYEALEKIEGIVEAKSYDGYNLHLERVNNLFPWKEELVPQILKVIRTTIARDLRMVMAKTKERQF
jgi:hypothetical protein